MVDLNLIIISVIALGPIILTFTATFLLHDVLKSPQISWLKIALSIFLLLLVCGLLISFNSSGLVLLAVIELPYIFGATILASLFLAFSLKRWRKLAGLFLALGYSTILFLSFWISLDYSPESIRRKDGEAIIQALYSYREDKGIYPKTLKSLQPYYLAYMKDSGTLWGWLYTVNESDFTLGYVSDVDKWGYSICKFSATNPEWFCTKPPDYSTAPFKLEPTPSR